MIYKSSDEYDKAEAIFKFNYLLENKKTFNLTEQRENRTPKQNAYLHALFAMYAMEFGWTMAEAKRIVKVRTGYTYEKRGQTWLVETSKMDTLEMSHFIEKFMIFASQEGFYLMTALEYKKNRARVDREIQKHKIYL